MRTAEPNVYAVGDVAGGLLLAHVAAAEGTLAAEAIAGQNPEPIDYSRMPRVVYTRPRVGGGGPDGGAGEGTGAPGEARAASRSATTPWPSSETNPTVL